jgi:ribosome-associated toxin RatA of RatAB toxin-antitoxin module
MREVHRSALVPFSPGQLFDLVADVERYPEFLPWCTSAVILVNDGHEVTVQLGLALGPARGSFTTRNRMTPGRAVEMQLVEGPFSALEGRWLFTPIGDAGTRAELRLRFETSGFIGGVLFGPAFEQACNQLVDAFGRRAREVYGER